MRRDTSLHELVRWSLENLDVPPMRLVSREVDDGGKPQWTAEFRRWLFSERTLHRLGLKDEEVRTQVFAASTPAHLKALFSA